MIYPISVINKSLDGKTASLKKTINTLVVVLDSVGPGTEIAVQQLRQTVRVLDLASWYASTKAVFYPSQDEDRQILTRAKNTCSYVADSWGNLKTLGELQLLDMTRIMRGGRVLAERVSTSCPPVAFVVSLAIEPVMKGFTITANILGVCEQIYHGKHQKWQDRVELTGRIVDLTANVALFCLFPQGVWIKKISTVLLWVRVVVKT